MSSKKINNFRGIRLKDIRYELRLTQSKLADLIGKHPVDISKYERNEVMPSADTLAQLAKKCKVNLNWLLTGEGEMFVKEKVTTEEKKDKNDDTSYKSDTYQTPSVRQEKPERYTSEEVRKVLPLLETNPEIIPYIIKYSKIKRSINEGDRINIQFIVG